MSSFRKIYEGIEDRIGEWEDIAREDAEYNIENGYSMDDAIEDADSSNLELVEEIEKMSFFLDEDQGAIDRLVELAHAAFSNVEDFIIELYEG